MGPKLLVPFVHLTQISLLAIILLDRICEILVIYGIFKKGKDYFLKIFWLWLSLGDHTFLNLKRFFRKV